MAKPVLVSGIQPSGRLHVGNYLGALKNFVELQNSGKYQCYFFIADLHSLTESFDPKEKSKQILELTADYLAAGLDPKKSTIFLQSLIPAHSELAWILNTITPKGELERMTQFREKSGGRITALIEALKGLLKMDATRKYGDDFIKKLGKEFGDVLTESMKKAGSTERIELYVEETTNVGLFTYPTLMAADIILYDAKFVPVGNDQDQHLELTRTLARKFNQKFGKTFVEPRPLHTKTPRVMSLNDPLKKMSKSQLEGCLFLDDSPEEIKKKIGRAVTDSGSEVKYDREKKPGVSNLLEIFSSLSGTPIPELEKEFRGKNYAAFKAAVAEKISEKLAEFRSRKTDLRSKTSALRSVLEKGSASASKIASKKIEEVKKRVGIAI